MGILLSDLPFERNFVQDLSAMRRGTRDAGFEVGSCRKTWGKGVPDCSLAAEREDG
jgi:hypothetical protein